MGCSPSKPEKNEAALALCTQRVRFIKEAIDARFALSAAHVAYIQSLRSVGIALRRLAEAEISVESSLSTSEPDKSPSHSSYASPSPSRLVEAGSSPFLRGCSLSPPVHNINYMKAADSRAVEVGMNSCANHLVEEDEFLSFPPPPPSLPRTTSWDFFDPVESIEHAVGLQNCQQCYKTTLGSTMGVRAFKEDEVLPLDSEEAPCNKYGSGERKDSADFSFRQDNNKMNSGCLFTAHSNKIGTLEESPERKEVPHDKENLLKSAHGTLNSSFQSVHCMVAPEQRSLEKDNADHGKEECSEREDASEFITHRAKDFLSSFKDIEYRFVKAAEHGSEVSGMLEANKVRLSSCTQRKGIASSSILLEILHIICCKENAGPGDEPLQTMAKVITWNRSTSSLSSSSKNPLSAAAKDDACDSGSDLVDEFSMISGSHSSTLDRLYAWERKLYDEVKGSESVRKQYDQKCSQLRHECAKDFNPQVIDKTRAVVKDLYSRVRVAIQVVDSISKRIEKLRDEELQPQLIELVQGFSRMWKSMLECHHSQCITISLAYRVKNSTAASQNESYKQALLHLQNEIEFYRSSFANWIDSHMKYVKALNTWLQNCILPQERSRGRRAVVFSPRRALAPPIFVLSRDWLAAIESLPPAELFDVLGTLLSELHGCLRREVEENQNEAGGPQPGKEAEDHKASSLGILQPNLTRVFNSLTKFAEASLKMYEELKQGNETARIAYANGRMRFFM